MATTRRMAYDTWSSSSSRTSSLMNSALLVASSMRNARAGSSTLLISWVIIAPGPRARRARRRFARLPWPLLVWATVSLRRTTPAAGSGFVPGAAETRLTRAEFGRSSRGGGQLAFGDRSDVGRRALHRRLHRAAEVDAVDQRPQSAEARAVAQPHCELRRLLDGLQLHEEIQRCGQRDALAAVRLASRDLVLDDGPARRAPDRAEHDVALLIGRSQPQRLVGADYLLGQLRPLAEALRVRDELPHRLGRR